MPVSGVTAADIPNIYDLAIGQVSGSMHGYILARQIDPNIPFRTQRARYAYSPTFVQRTNTSGDYGDNQQDFWLTVAMRDWSLGEDQRFFRSQDPEKSRQYWHGQNIDVSVPGQASIQNNPITVTFGESVDGCIGYPTGSVIFATGATHLYEVSSAGVVTDRGAHGVGGSPTALALDGTYLYLSYGGGSKVRRYDLSAHTFADFSATQADSLVFLNNTLYGTLNNILYTYDTAGTATASFTFKNATGGALAGTMKLIAFGGKVEILRNSGSTNGTELWEYDGTGVAKLAEYPPNFSGLAFCVQSGIIFIIGKEAKGTGYRAAIWYYANGTIGRAWAHPLYGTTLYIQHAIAAFGNGLLFTEPNFHDFRYYDLQTGGTSTVYNQALSASQSHFAATDTFALYTGHNTTGLVLFDPTQARSQAYLETSIVDFESTLTKLFRGVIVDFIPGSDGDGGSVDVWYTIDKTGYDTGLSYNSLVTGATTGVENKFSGAVTGRGISLHVLLNKGTSTYGPTLKRIYVRAAPLLSHYRTGEYIIDATGRDGKTPVQLRNGMSHPFDGKQMMTNLTGDATSGNLLTIVDRLGTYTGIIELDTMDVVEVKPDEYYIRFTAREV